MDITLLIESFIGLSTILGVLIFFLLYIPSQKRKLKKSKEEEKTKKGHIKKTLRTLVSIIKDKKSNSQELKNALDLILKDYGIIDKFDIYGEVLIRICRHPNTTKDIILDFNRDLENQNPEYSIEINDFIAKGLNSR